MPLMFVFFRDFSCMKPNVFYCSVQTLLAADDTLTSVCKWSLQQIMGKFVFIFTSNNPLSFFHLVHCFIFLTKIDRTILVFMKAFTHILKTLSKVNTYKNGYRREQCKCTKRTDFIEKRSKCCWISTKMDENGAA